VQALVDAGDEVVAVTPVWPNLTAAALIMGGRLRTVALVPVDGAWTLDLQSPARRHHPRTQAAGGECAQQPDRLDPQHEEQAAILAHCRTTGTWILADEVYENLTLERQPHRACAPNFWM